MSGLPPLRREGPTTILPNRSPASPSMTAIRRRFATQGLVDEQHVPAPILRSWRRCAALGLRMDMRPEVEPIGRADLDERRERARRLAAAAAGEMRLLHEAAAGTRSIVLLTDADGVVLDRLGDDGFAAAAARLALAPGVSWRERATGTNAIGTALAERREVTVFGEEHFFEANRILSCTAAPILDPRGAALGVLDLSDPAETRSPHAAALVRRAVGAIEHRLFADLFEDCDVVALHDDPNEIGGPREGLLAFRDDRLIGANRAGLALVGRDWDALDRTVWSSLFDTRRPGGDGAEPLTDIAGRRLWARLRAPRPPLPRSPSAASNPTTPRPVRADLVPVHRPAIDGLVWDEARARALARAGRLLDAAVPVLVQGETGTGKEVFARALHAGSKRAGRPFVAVNCAALPEGLIEAELFGYEEGAFTGARRKGAKGLMREADGGVLFLDEIGDMPLALQARLLRALQEREVTPLGGGRPVAVDFALVCATHRRLADAVAAGEFRQDLYFRIAQYTVELAPLRGRPDLTQVIDRLWAAEAARVDGVTLSAEVVDRLRAHDWPGNFRQLTTLLRTLAILAEPGETLTLDALPADLRSEPDPRHTPTDVTREIASAEDRAERLDELTLTAMRAMIVECGGNVSRAAARLGVHRSTLYRRLAGRDA